jgi:hypothetical protein
MTARAFGGWRSVAVLVALSVSCDGGGVRPTTGPLALGTWGGTNAAVIVTDSVTHVHIGCTYGDVSGRIELDDNGQFQVDGTYVLLAYPIPVGPTLPAQFSGQVVGNTLTFAVAVNDTTTGKVKALGPVSVRLGRPPEMGPCPICRVPRKPAGLPPSAGRRDTLRWGTKGATY